MKALPKLSKAQAEAWERVLEWYAYPTRNSYFTSSTTRRYVTDKTVPAQTKTLEALRNRGILVSVPSDAIFSTPRYAIHPDYLPDAPVDSASEPAAPEREPELTANAEYWNGLTQAQQYDLWNLNDGNRIWSHRLANDFFYRLSKEYPGLIQSDGIHFGLTEAASEMVERYGMNADGSFKRQASVTPEREPERKKAMIYSVTLRYNIGDRVRVLVGKWQGMECTVIGANALGADETSIKKVYRVADSDGNEGTVWYTYRQLEPAAPEPEPETVADDHPTVDEARLIDIITELGNALMPISDVVQQYPRLSPEAQLNANTMLLQTTHPFTWGHLTEVANAYNLWQEARLIETINELKALVTELEAENERLNNKQQIMTLRIERLKLSRDTWSGMYVQVVKEKQESEAKHE